MELIRENIYNSFIYQDRYKYYLTGLGNTIIMAFFACLIGVILGLFYLKSRKELQVVSVVSEIDSYNYYLESIELIK